MYKLLKRLLDVFAAICALVLLSPIFIITVICLLIVNNGKPFFYQQRPGKNEKLFSIIKFKTMRDAKKGEESSLHNVSRVTKVGSFIRKYSIDEIPQLINVIKGDMSIIGPRPLLVNYLKLYNNEQKKRHNVRPGISGWAQVKGRNALSWNEKFTYDVWYVNNQSFFLDLKIILLTVKRIIKPEGINNSDSDGTTMPEFKGNN
jgi:lipopolysaccharide/colanic/teichoic acid biosynthesis glycosyltransferase